MRDLFAAFVGPVSKEINRLLVQKLQVRVFVYNIGSYCTFHLKSAVINGCVYFHAAGVDHRTKQSVLGQVVIQQHRNSQYFQRRNTDQWDVTSVTNSFRHRNPDSKSGIRTRPTAHCDCIQRDGMTVYERQRFIYKNS